MEEKIKYTRGLIKGKITELIFEEMFRISEEFTIIPLGYERTTPILAQYQRHVHIQKVLENIRHAPDFALISQNKEEVFLVEVKYRNEINNERILQIAQDLNDKWSPCFLFVANHEGFYFSPCSSIIKNNGEIELLRESWIREETQKTYLSLLKEFI